jgi:mono/diheme cytochrome c family protein
VQTLEEGKALFQTYCMVCHGEQGRGDGPISGKIPPPPSYVSDRLMQFPPGRIFYVITMGTNKMPSYATQLSRDERWKVVTYVHTSLQGFKDESGAVQQGGLR